MLPAYFNTDKMVLIGTRFRKDLTHLIREEYRE